VKADAQEIERGLRLLCLPGHYYELRAVHVPHGTGGTRTFSKTFTQPDGMARQAAALSDHGAKGVYFTLNPVAPAVEKNAKDGQVERRALLLVDCDPTRPPDTNATDSEKGLAYDKALQVRDHLKGLGWPVPVLADSGNGYHLLYRIDLPNDDAATLLVHNVLRALADHFNADAVKIDTKVFNAARICKAYGTLARKGQDSQDRPWRYSKLLEYPEALAPVPRELLEKLAAEAPAVPEKAGGKHAPVPSGERPRPWEGLKLAGIKNRAAAYIQSMPASISGQGGHDALFRVALAAVRGFGLTPEQAEKVIQRYYNVPERCKPVWSRDEVLHKLDDAENASYAEWHYLLRPEPPHTDMGNAQRLVRDHGHDLRYVAAWGKWLVWDGRRWAEDTTGEIVRRAKRTVTGMEEQARKKLAAVQDRLRGLTEADEGYKALAAKEARYVRKVKYALGSQARSKLDAMIALAKSEPGVAVDHQALNADPWLLNVANGTIDLKAGTLRPHRREDLVTKLAPVAYDPAATSPLWEQFIGDITQGEDALAGYLQQVVGYSLTGDVSEQCLFFCWGGGANGKTTFLRAVGAVLGDYAMAAAGDFLISLRADGHSTGIMDLHGKRLVACNEPPQGKLNESLVKFLTGSDKIRGRRLYQDQWEFDPTHKLIVAGNHKPDIQGVDDGIWRRIRLVPFTAKFDKPDKKMLDNLLRDARPAILAWAVQGCQAWQALGLESPDVVAEATASYRSESDPLNGFFEEKCEEGPGLRVENQRLYAKYQAWAKVADQAEMSAPAFKRALTDRGYEQRRSGKNGGREWHGLALREGKLAGQLTG
jgi:P4 family phage/plasmid primase-like protien